MTNPFKVFFANIGHFFEDVWKKIASGNIGGAEQELIQMANKYSSEAMVALKTINSIIPNKTVSEIMELGQKYQLETSSLNVSDPSAVQAFILSAVEKELAQLVPEIPATAIDFVVQTAFAAIAKNSTVTPSVS